MRSIIRFFSSLRLAIALLIFLAVASVIGTLIPQARSVEEYAARYGAASGLLIKLQLTGLYHSLWYLALLGLLGLNIIVCTLTRLGGKIRRAFRPRLETEAKALTALKIKDRLKRSAPLDETRAALEAALHGAGYRVRSAAGDGRVSLLARKRMAGLFGSDLVHVGLLVLLAGALVTAAGSVRSELPMREGQTLDVPGAGFALRLDKFETEYYPDESVKAWKSAVTVMEAGQALRGAVISVNRPLTHRGFSFYQMSYGFDWDAPTLTLAVKKKDDAAPARTMTLKPGQRLPLRDPEGTEIALLSFLPDFVLGEGNQPENRSSQPNNPAAQIEVWRKGRKAFEGWIFANYPDFAQMHGSQVPDLTVELKAFDAAQTSVLEAAKDPGVPLVWLGCLLGMAGLFLAFYWPTWEIRALLEEGKGQTDISLGGTAAKSRDRFALDFESIVNAFRRPK
ncbi:MAG: cytochrome c biogenesis protein ResB [Candidatus Aminicenantes bacterium]|nr:cytochrome c biogenesis protein ResB [Candidatus Aminicenantes bacterium]